VFKAFRDPNSTDQQQYSLPYMLGDGINYSGSPIMWFQIPKHQYEILKQWAAGDFVDDMGPLPWRDEAPDFDQIPLSEQPDALTRAALEMCSGGAFHPGVELTWPLRHRELYQSPYRVAPSTTRQPDLIQDLGQLLTPELAFKGAGTVPPAIAPQMPGDLTRWMGLPWQCDAFSCQQVVFSNDFPNAAWWPALLPIDVLPQNFYDSVMDPALSPEQRVKFFQSRVAWSRGVAGIGYHADASYTDGLNQMIYLWNRMGFVVKRPAPPDRAKLPGVPERLFVEVDRGVLRRRRAGRRRRGLGGVAHPVGIGAACPARGAASPIRRPAGRIAAARWRHAPRRTWLNRRFRGGTAPAGPGELCRLERPLSGGAQRHGRTGRTRPCAGPPGL
jgi:hypothetical protein